MNKKDTDLYNIVSMEEELLIKSKNGNKDAFGKIMMLYSKRVYNAAYSFLHNVDDSTDMVQEVFMRAFRNMASFDTQQSFYPWIYRITKNLCLNKLKLYENKNISLPEFDLQCEKTDCPETSYIKKEEKEKIQSAISSLNEKHKEILILKHFQNCSYDEIAEILNIPKGTVMSRLYNARQSLRGGVIKERTMKCEDALYRIQALVDNELDQDEISETVNHMESCYKCRQEYIELLELQRRLKGISYPQPEEEWIDKRHKNLLRKLNINLAYLFLLVPLLIFIIWGAVSIFSNNNINIVIKMLVGGIIIGVNILFFVIGKDKVLENKQDRYKGIKKVILVTTDHIPGKKIVKVYGLVRGNTIRARHAGKDILACFKNLIGGEIVEYTKMMAESREQSLDRLMEDAESLGANAVIGLNFATTSMMQGAAELLVYGTAVYVEDI